MIRTKKIALILLTILLGSSGLLFGCKDLYSRINLDASVEEIILYINSENIQDAFNTPEDPEEGEEPIEEETEGTEEVEESVEEGTEEELEGENIANFTVSIKNLPKNVSNNLIVNKTITGVVKVEETEKDAEINDVTFKVTALKAGQTVITVKTEEGGKEISIPVTVIQEVESMELNENYNAMVVVGQESGINTMQAIKFLPITTNQKDVVYALTEQTEGVTITEAGYILVEQKTTNYITVRATNIANENLYVDINVKIIEPILLENVILIKESEPIENITLATNRVEESQGEYEIVVEGADETLNVDLQVNTTSNIDIEKLTNTSFFIRSIELGQAILTARVEVVGYEQYYITKTFEVQVLEYPKEVSINNVVGTLNNQEIFDTYTSSMGTPFVFRVGAVGAYNKLMKLEIEQEDLDKIEIRYSDGTLVDVLEDILPNNITLYIKAKAQEEGEVLGTVSLKAVALATVDMGDEIVYSTLNMQLKKGAEDIGLVNTPDTLSIEHNDEVVIEFEALPTDSALGSVTLLEVTKGIISQTTSDDPTQFIIRGIKTGNTRLVLVSSNGINKTIEVEVYKELEDVALSIDSPEQNYAVAKTVYEQTTSNNSTLKEAVLAVGSGVSLNVTNYPFDASIVNVAYTTSSATVATISTSGYIVARSLGTATIMVTITKKVRLSASESELQTTVRQFELTVYMPIISTQLNYYEHELYDSNSLSYYEMDRSQLQLDLNINPINATFNKENIVWTDNSNYATVSADGLVQVSLPAEINSATVKVTATINEYNRYYTQRAIIKVRKPVKVTGVSVLNVKEHLYFDARNGLGEENAQTAGFKLNAQAYPVNATNKNLVYKYVQNDNDLNLEKVVIVKPDGTIIPNRAGNATIYVIAQDSYTSANDFTKYTALKVRVADGASDETAIELKNAQELMAINTLDGLTLHYVISQTIDLTGVQLSPIGIIDDILVGFSGVINGYFTFNDFNVENQIIGANFNITNQERNNNMGLFASLNGGTIKNLAFRVNALNYSLNSNSINSKSNVGSLVGKNDAGIIDNVKVEIFSSNVGLATRENNVGGIVGFNDGQIVNSNIYGNLKVFKRQGIAVEPHFNVGGLAGYNSGSITGNFDVYNNNLIENYSSFNSHINISYLYMDNIENNYGGIVGYNTNLVEGVTAAANVKGLNNVGGAIGQNTGVVNKVLSASFVEGINNVGGLTGTDAGTITNSLTLILDQFALDAVVKPQIIGINNVGGLVGFASNSVISYSYAKSFYTRVIDNDLYFGDLVVDIPQNYTNSVYVGGLVGLAEQVTITSAYSQLNIIVNDSHLTNVNVYGGGILGSNSILATIEDVYAKGLIASQANAYLAGVAGQLQGDNSAIRRAYSMVDMTGTNFEGIIGSVSGNISYGNIYYLDTTASVGAYGMPATYEEMQQEITYSGFDFVNLFDIDANYNDGTPFIVYANGTKKMLIQAPTNIEVTVNEGVTALTTAEQLKNNHFKIDNKKAAVYYYENADTQLNTYSLDNELGIYGNPIIEKAFTPNVDNIGIVGFISSNTDIARITTDGLLEVYKEGVVKITIYSILDKNVYDEIEVAVVKPVTNFNIYEEDLEEAEQSTGFKELTNSIITIDELKRIYPVINAQIDDAEYAYNTLSYLNYYITNQVGVSFEGFNWSDYIANIGFNQAHVLRGDYVEYDGLAPQDFTINVLPQINIEFEDGTSALSLHFLEKQFNIKVVEGSKNIELSSYEANISLKDIFLIDVELETDIADSAEPNRSVIDVEKVERVAVVDGQTQLIDVTDDDELRIEIVEGWQPQLPQVNRVYRRYEVEINNKTNSIYASEQNYVITFASYDKSLGGVKLEGEPAKLTTELNLNIIPQEVFRIDMNYYAANEIFENADGVFYNPNELPANSITAGKIGLLKIGVYPEFANMDYLQLEYEANNDYTLSMEQALFTTYIKDEQETLGYTAITPQAELLSNGIKLSLSSNKINDVYSYDGNLYVRLLISSSTSTNTQFIIKATAYSILADGTHKKGLEQPLTLNVQPASDLTLTYNSSTDDAYMAVEVKERVVIAVSKLDVTNPNEINWNLQNLTTDAITFVKASPSVTLDYVTEFEFDVKIPSGNKADLIIMQAYIERTVNNNKQQYKSNVMTVFPALFTIENITVKNVNNTDKYFTAAYGGSYELGVRINAKYNEDIVDIDTRIADLEKELSYQISGDGNITSTWYKRMFGATGAQDTMLVANSEEYSNYKINKGAENVFIQPKRVSEGDIIVAKIQFRYDYLAENSDRVAVAYFEDLSQKSVGLSASGKFIMEYEFKTQFYLRASEDNPIPVYDEEGLKSMQEGSSYILLSDLQLGSPLDPWQPLTTEIRSLDGNGFTITIDNFFTHEEGDTTIPSTKNFGLFDSIGQDTMLKNIKVNLSNVTIDARVYKKIIFGGLVGLNNGGVIYNSQVTSLLEDDSQGAGIKILISTTIDDEITEAYIGGLVARNSGFITNSRSELRLEANKGYVAGITAYNSGTIASSYYKNGFIKNTSQTQVSAGVGGVVVFNATTGKIRGSYVEGRVGSVEAPTVEKIIINEGKVDEQEVITGRIIGGGLEFAGDLAGFVYENQGSITDSYSNIRVVSQSRSAGFVFVNSGTVNNSYSMSKVAYNVAAHTPFTGTNNQGMPRNSGSITSSYYMNGYFAGKAQEIATKVLVEDWGSEASFTGFSFSKDANNAFYGVWEIKEVNTVNTPYLISANTIAESKRKLEDEDIDEDTNEIDYEYSYIVTQVEGEEDINYTVGTPLNPHIIWNNNTFNSVLAEEGIQEGNLFNQYVRVVKDFDFALGGVAATSAVNFAGVMDGNGMTISNISVVSSSETSTNEIGLLKKLTDNGAGEVGLIKNLNLQFDEVFANNAINVGSLAGIIENAKVYNLNISGANTVVEGKNIVGGLAGKIIGSSHIINVQVQISVNSSYREAVNINAPYDIYNATNDALISYAGAVAGIADVQNGFIENIKVTGNSSIIGENVGGAFGLLGNTTNLNTVTVEVVKNQFLRTTKVVGGIVGENRGIINNAIIRHTTAVQTAIDGNRLLPTPVLGEVEINQNTSLFAGVGHVAGGVVGLNNGGTITNSTSKVDVRNSNILVAGGLVGRSVGGNIQNSYAYGSVLAEQVVGGLIGAVTTRDLIAGDSNNLIKDDYQAQVSSDKLIIEEVFAYNNWLNLDYNALVSTFTGEAIVKGGLIGVIQSPGTIEEYFEDEEENSTIDKNQNAYINSIYSSDNYSEDDNWHLISEYGYISGGTAIVYSESNELVAMQYNDDYSSYNDNNKLGIGYRVYDLTDNQLFPS
jgi:hypothetical protein